MIYRFRVILDTEEDVFRDLEIQKDATFEGFHNIITQAFGFDGGEMASFYTSDETWNQGQEISLFDMSDSEKPIKLMQETQLESLVTETAPRLIYIYDFLSMWTFMVELAEVAEFEPGVDYPNVMFAHGQLPDSAPEKEFRAEQLDDYGEEEPRDSFVDLDEYEDLGFNENWN